MAVIWREDMPFPQQCEYHEHGCQCGSYHGLSADELEEDPAVQPESCRFCNYNDEHISGCEAEDWQPDEGESWDDQPDCDCEFQCDCCQCTCECHPLELDADSYNKWIRQVCYACPSGCLSDELLESKKSKNCLIQVGSYEFYVRNLPTHHTVFGGFLGFGAPQRIKTIQPIYQEHQRGYVSYNDVVHIPILSRPSKRRGGEDQVWMSLTPMEVFSQREAISLAHGKVLIAGLGMGWLTQRVLDNPEVENVTQVEINPDILSFFGTPLVENNPGRIVLIHSDIWKYLEQVDHRQFETVLFDIWPYYRDARDDKKFSKLMGDRTSRRLTTWGWGY
jgi:hypothetical protein